METKIDIRSRKPGDSDLKKAGKSFGSLIKGLFIPNRNSGRTVLEEEALQTPAQTIMKNFFRNRLGVLGLIMFVLILAFSFVGSQLRPLDLAFMDTSLRNIRPGTNFLNFPSQLAREGVKQISSGVSFSVALSEKGNLFVWGSEPNFNLPGVSEPVLRVPSEVRNANIVQVAAGDRHILALDSMGRLYGWGQNDHRQAQIPVEVTGLLRGGLQVVRLVGGELYSAVLLSDGTLHVWGATLPTRMETVPAHAQGRIVDLAHNALNMLLILDDGSVMPMGVRGNEFSTQIPEALQHWSLIDEEAGEPTEERELKVVQAAATNRTVLALDNQGNLHLWGSAQYGINRMPGEVLAGGKVKQIAGGRNNLMVLFEDGRVVYWGANHFGQADSARVLEGRNVTRIFSNFYQHFAITENGNILPWGFRGFAVGSDQFGRDNLTRLIHGGRITLTVGAIAVVISTIIALFVGMTSGFFGGFVDNIMMRLTEVVQSIPFLPLAITLSVVIGGRLTESQRIFMIMVILGILGWTGLARLIRAQILLEREKDFVLAARALGVKKANIIIRHIMPNILNLVLVSITLGYAGSLLTESGLSFLGFGVAPPTPSWGNMLTGSQTSAVIRFLWWRWIIPGGAVVFAALSINLVGDALRDAMDPKANEK